MTAASIILPRHRLGAAAAFIGILSALVGVLVWWGLYSEAGETPPVDCLIVAADFCRAVAEDNASVPPILVWAGLVFMLAAGILNRVIRSRRAGGELPMGPPAVGVFVLRGLVSRAGIIIVILAAIAVAMPFAAKLPTDSPFYVAPHEVQLWGKYLTYALLAVSVNLVWGYCGILSLGHAAFFAIGGYAMGMYLMRQIGSRGVYGNPILPDFMVFLQYQELPWFWLGFDQFWFAAIMIVLVPGLLAFLFGWLAFRSRVSGVYLSIITQALTFALWLAFFRNDLGFGGNNGLTDYKDILGYPVQALDTRIALFSASAIALALGVFIVAAVVRSRFGKVLVGVRDAESRTRFLGYRVESYKVVVWVLSAMMAGVAGALYVPQVGIINPSEFAPAKSIEAVIWVAVGGRGTFFGPILGAIGINIAKSELTVAYPDYWLFFLGGLFIVVTLLLPRGIVGTLGVAFGWGRERMRRRPKGPPAEPDAPVNGRGGHAAYAAAPAAAAATAMAAEDDFDPPPPQIEPAEGYESPAQTYDPPPPDPEPPLTDSWSDPAPDGDPWDPPAGTPRRPTE